MAKHKCPVCGRSGAPMSGGLFRCSLGHLFDSEPNEGGDYDRDPSRRLERAEELAKARRENAERRPGNARGFRFKR